MTESSALSLSTDDPAKVDLLSFGAVAPTVADALGEAVDPAALGSSYSRGSGKATVLGLVGQELDRRTSTAQEVLVIQSDPRPLHAQSIVTVCDCRKSSRRFARELRRFS